MIAGITFLIEAGAISEDDDLMAFIQGLAPEQAAAVADWLALATNKQVKLRHIAPPFGVFEIVKSPADVKVTKLDRDS